MGKVVMILAWLRVPQPPAKISPNKLLYSIDCEGPGIGRLSHQPYATHTYYAPLELKAAFLHRIHVKLIYQ
jgi:hypothetical protein